MQEGEKTNNSRLAAAAHCQLRTACDWKMLVDVGQRLAFIPEIAATTLRLDLVNTPSSKKVYIVELTVPWEKSVEEAFERKHLRYADLAAEAH